MGSEGKRWGKRRRLVRETLGRPGAVSLLDDEVIEGARAGGNDGWEGRPTLAVVAIKEVRTVTWHFVQHVT
jgi:hypothetical protein